MEELIQMDASQHLWFGKDKSFLHIAIDDASSTIVGAFFDVQETLKGYYHVTKQMLTNYGFHMKFSRTIVRFSIQANKKKVPCPTREP